ncbi:hypothetical protein [Streptomyces verrucosisporus]|nr:hypothetical protein [Streptomyces verrucosisporus]
MTVSSDPPPITSPDELVRLVESGGRLYVRWSRGPGPIWGGRPARTT